MPKFNNVNTAADSLVGARMLRTVTPSDTADLPDGIPDALWINTSGLVNVCLVGEDDEPNGSLGVGGRIIFSIVGPGILDVRPRRVMATGTTATNIVAFY